MRFSSVEFARGVARPADLPIDGLPEVAFAGRSNVGKSSLINRLLERRRLAHTSSTPGKTRQLNYYRVDNRLYLVDLPGYGYARGSKPARAHLGKLVESYLRGRRPLRAVLQLIDARREPTELDWLMIEWLRQEGRPFLLVFTKADKVSRSQLNQCLARLEAQGALAGLPFVPFSAITGQGREDIWEWIDGTLD
jgi:GTP-binding protein